MVPKNKFYNLELLLEQQCRESLLTWWGSWSRKDVPNLGYKTLSIYSKTQKTMGISEAECEFIDSVLSATIKANPKVQILFLHYAKRLSVKKLCKLLNKKQGAVYYSLNSAKTVFWEELIKSYAKAENKTGEWIDAHISLK